MLFYLRGTLAGHQVAFIGLTDEGLERVSLGNVASLDGVNGADLKLDGVRWISVLRATSQEDLVRIAREGGVKHIAREYLGAGPIQGVVVPKPERRG